MPVLKISFGKSSARMIGYLLNQNESGDRVQALGGSVAGRDSTAVEQEFRETRNYFNQHDGRQYYHVALSFERQDLGDMVKPDGAPDHEKIRDYGEEWAREAEIEGRYEYLVVVHGEKEHPHAHVIWNATSFDGMKYRNGRHNLDTLRDANDKLARKHGIQRELDRVRDPHRPSDKFIRQAERGGSRYSWKLDMQDRIREAGRRAFSEEQFRARLQQRGVELRVRGEKYSYSMKDRNGKQRTSREGKLGEPYQRTQLLEKFEKQKKQLRLDPEGYMKRLKEERAKPYSWQRDLRGRIIEELRTAKNHESFQQGLERKGVTAHVGDDGLYRFSFKDQHGLSHEEVAVSRLYPNTPDRIGSRISENAERAVVPTLTRAAGREAGGLAATIMRQAESATREPQRGHEGHVPTRDHLRQERQRERHEEGNERGRW